MKIAILFFALLLITASQFVIDRPERVRLVVAKTGNPLPPYNRRKKFKGYMRKH